MATVLSFIRKSNGEPLVEGSVIFRPNTGGAPGYRIGAVVPPDSVTVLTDASGFFCTPLFAGTYRVMIGSAKKYPIITVPEDDLIHLLEDLMGDAAGVAPAGSTPINYRTGAGYIQFLGTDDGKFYTLRVAGESGAPTLALDPPTLFAGPLNYRFNSGSFDLWNDDTGEWYSPQVVGDVRTPGLAFAGANVSSPGNYRIHNRKFQLLNGTTSTWHTPFITGTGATFSPPDTSS